MNFFNGKRLGRGDPNGSGDKDLKHGILLSKMMLGFGMKVSIGVSFFPDRIGEIGGHQGGKRQEHLEKGGNGFLRAP